MSTDQGASLNWRHGLSFRLFGLTVGIILLVELLIFIPSAAGYRNNWLEERVAAGRVAALALEAAPSNMVSEELAAALLANAEVLGVAESGEGIREQLLAPRVPITDPIHMVDIREYRWFRNLGSLFGTAFAEPDRTLVIKAVGSRPYRTIEVIVPEEPLRADLAGFSLRIIGLSLIISVSAGALVFLALFYQVVRPVQQFTRAVVDFSKDPGGMTRRLTADGRRDEIGRAQRALADMEETVSDAFRQRERLAELGEAMAKINHDLRNSLASAQLSSEILSQSEDPRVRRAAPRLERAIERAISLARQTLEYGRADPPSAACIELELRTIVEMASEEALADQSHVAWRNDVAPDASAYGDPDHTHRIFVNLIRNAAQAMAGQERPAEIIATVGGQGGIELRDTGPGLPDRARENLFKPFAGSSKRDGTGLGLAIARELCRTMRGDVRLKTTGPDGTVFQVLLPTTKDGGV
ncbi:MAG: HAMP domain-containing sensor histidine kinase [Pseudomonadota bacterium]